MKQRSRTWLSIREPDPELAWMVLVSVVVHLAGAVLLLVVPRQMLSSTPPPVVAYTVKIVDPSSLGGRLPRGPLRPDKAAAGSVDAVADAPKPEPKASKKPEPAPPPEPKPAEKIVKIPEKKLQPKPAEKKPVQRRGEKKAPAKAAPKRPSAEELARKEREERDRQIQEAIRRVGERGQGKEAAGLGGREEGKGAALGTGGDGGGGGILMGLDFIMYKNQVEGIIRRNWTWVGANPKLTVRVGFRIQRDGQITDMRVVERSGDASYDDSVLKAIGSSTPLPPPPEQYRDVFADYLLDFLSGDLQSR